MPMDNEDLDRIKNMQRQMGEFIAYFEVAQNKMVEWRKEVNETIEQHQHHVHTQIKEIHDVVDEIRELTDAAGLARIKYTAEQVVKQGQENVETLERVGQAQLEALQQNNEQLKKLAKKSFDRVDRALNYMVQSISQSLSSVRIGDFKRLTDKSRESIEEISVSTVNRLRDMVKWFHWKNLAMACGITMIVSLTIGLYLNDEMPWEIHKQVVVQRNAGQALLSAWPKLSELEKDRIMKHAKKAII